MPTSQDSYNMMSTSPQPPRSLISYSQFMHEHTKRQMEANGSRSARSSTSSDGSMSNNGSMSQDYGH
ncbi:hypothetical protein E4U23_001406 [Claviceps purpurea]|nr:hypothetical protein E4U23_001406 [Claviceps purpurea]